MAELTPQQHAWIQAYQQRQAALLQQNQQNFLQSQPWRQPGFTQFQNPLMARAQIPLATGNETESDPQAGYLPYFMGMMGNQPQGGEGMNPQLMHMLLSGSMGFSG